MEKDKTKIVLGSNQFNVEKESPSQTNVEKPITEIENQKEDINLDLNSPINSVTEPISETPELTPDVIKEQVAPIISGNIYPTATKGSASNYDALEKESGIFESKTTKPLLYVSALAVSLTLVFSIISSLSGLLEIAFNHVGEKTTEAMANPYSITNSYLDSYELKLIVWFASSLVISGAIYLLILRFINKNRLIILSSFASKVHNLIYGAFLSILTVLTIASFTNLVYSCFVPLIPKGKYDAGPTAWWPGIVQALITTSLMALVLFYYYRKIYSSERSDV